MTHICVGELIIIVSDNGLSPGRRQAIFWTNAGILLIGPYGTNFSEFLIEILTFSFTKMSLKVSSVKWRPFCLGLNVLKCSPGAIELPFSFFFLDDCQLPCSSDIAWKGQSAFQTAVSSSLSSKIYPHKRKYKNHGRTLHALLQIKLDDKCGWFAFWSWVQAI